jgi:hypothetical protein
MSAEGRTKGARSQKKTGFDPAALSSASGEARQEKGLSQAALQLLRREFAPEPKYEVPTTVPQRTLILNYLEEVLKDLIPARYWEYKKLWWFVFCGISSLFGIGGCLWALGETVLFADQRPSMARLGIACIMFLPFFCWVKVVFFAHGDQRVHLDEMTAKRAVRRHEQFLRDEHLEGRLPRPDKPVEIPDAPYEYQPDKPWVYERWRPKPKVYHYIDENGLAAVAEPGSEEELKAKFEEQKIKDMLTQSKKQNLVEAALSAMEEGKSDDEER